MSTKFYFQSIAVENFRSFRRLSLDKLRRINLFGGFNGVGKSALLETMFYVLDRRDPVAIFKPLNWRKVDQTGTLDPAQFLSDRDVVDAKIEAHHRDGKNTVLLRYEMPPPNVTMSVATTQRAPGFGTGGNLQGLSIKTSDSFGDIQEEIYVIPAVNGAIGNVTRAGTSNLPPAVILSVANRGHPHEAAVRLSAIVKQRRIPDLLDALRLLVPELKGVQTLQEGQVPQIYAEFENDFLPIQFLGDGFQNLFQTVIAIMNCRDGVVFLDEIDAALHYSKVPIIWKIVAQMAEKENCQIFATTHSRECIHSAADGIKDAGRAADFQYLRLEVDDEGGHRAVSYLIDEVKQAELADVEIR